MKYSVAIDIGGTNTRVALADEELNIIERKQFATDSENPDVTLGKIAEVIKSFDCDIVDQMLFNELFLILVKR